MEVAILMIEINLTRNNSDHMERGLFFSSSREKILEVCLRVYPTDRGERAHRQVGKGNEKGEYRHSIL